MLRRSVLLVLFSMMLVAQVPSGAAGGGICDPTFLACVFYEDTDWQSGEGCEGKGAERMEYGARPWVFFEAVGAEVERYCASGDTHEWQRYDVRAGYQGRVGHVDAGVELHEDRSDGSVTGRTCAVYTDYEVVDEGGSDRIDLSGSTCDRVHGLDDA